MKLFIKSISTILVLFVLSSCAKQQVEYDIPNIGVSEYIYLSNPTSFNLQVQGGWIYNQGGYKGLVIFRRYFNNDENDFIAYERACPNHYNQTCGILEVEDNSYLTCSCNSESFILFDGSPVDFASQNVKFYRTVFDGLNEIHVFN